MVLIELADRYVRQGPEFAIQGQFETDLLDLRGFMNAHCAGLFHSTAVNGYDPGFRIAHAQKSLSLILKHYWCNGIMSEPPCCPVDRRILLLADAGQSRAKWTDINSLPDYRDKLAILNRAAVRSTFAPISLSEWELEAFN